MPNQYRLHMEIRLTLTDCEYTTIYKDVYANNTYIADRNDVRLYKVILVDTIRTMLIELFKVKLPQEEVRHDDERTDSHAE